jgi:hypothetical protein
MREWVVSITVKFALLGPLLKAREGKEWMDVFGRFEGLRIIDENFDDRTAYQGELIFRLHIRAMTVVGATDKARRTLKLAIPRSRFGRIRLSKAQVVRYEPSTSDLLEPGSVEVSDDVRLPLAQYEVDEATLRMIDQVLEDFESRKGWFLSDWRPEMTRKCGPIVLLLVHNASGQKLVQIHCGDICRALKFEHIAASLESAITRLIGDVVPDSDH